MANWLDEVKKRGAAAWQGLRGSAEPAPPPDPGPGFSRAASPTSPLNASFETPLADHNAKIRAMNNPYLRSDAGQQAVGRANDIFQARPAAPQAARGAANDANLERQMRSARRGNILRGAGKALGAAGGLAVAADTAATGTDEYRRELGLPQTAAVGRGLRSMGASENVAQFADDLAVRFAGTANRVAFNPLSMLAGDDRAAAPRGAPVQPEVRRTGMENNEPGTWHPNAAGRERLLKQMEDYTAKNKGRYPGGAPAPIDAAGLIQGTGVPAEGTGAFQRSGGQPVAVRSAPVQPEVARPAGPQFQRGGFIDPVLFGNMVRAGTLASGKRFETEQQNKQMDQLLRAAQVRTAQGNATRDAAKAGREVARQRVQDIVESRTPTTVPGKLYGENQVDPKQREQDVRRRTADLVSRIEYSVADRKDGRTMADLSDTEFNQLAVANDLRERMEKADTGFWKKLKDYFGQNRFTSRSLYGYLPTHRSADGKTLYMQNGNVIDLSKAIGAEFNLFGPNSPVDADVQDMIRNLPERG
jgi:hypothetical protein